MMRQTSDAMVRAMGVKMHANRPAFPMMAIVDETATWGLFDLGFTKVVVLKIQLL